MSLETILCLHMLVSAYTAENQVLNSAGGSHPRSGCDIIWRVVTVQGLDSCCPLTTGGECDDKKTGL